MENSSCEDECVTHRVEVGLCTITKRVDDIDDVNTGDDADEENVDEVDLKNTLSVWERE